MPTTPSRPASDEFDALADLFLTDDPPLKIAAEPGTPGVNAPATGSGPAAPRSRRATIELLIQGHLPVRAAPWASQYARARASMGNATAALVRARGDQLSIELFGDTGDDPIETDSDRRALRIAAERASVILLQLDELHQPSAVADPRLAAVTVLSGADEAAVVAAYRTIKGLSSVLAPAASDDEDPPTDLQVAMVAPEKRDAIDAVERLRRAVAVFLDRPLRHAATVERIAPTGARTVYRGESTLGSARILDLLADPPHEQPAPDRAETPMHAAEASQSVEPRAPSPGRLAPLVPGLAALPFAVPDDPSIELALDASGIMHLLRENNDGRGVERLVAAAAWAVKHRSILAATTAFHGRLDPSQPPVMHLFTDSPKSVRHLADAAVRLHVVVPAGSTSQALDLN